MKSSSCKHPNRNKTSYLLPAKYYVYIYVLMYIFVLSQKFTRQNMNQRQNSVKGKSKHFSKKIKISVNSKCQSPFISHFIHS